jgi:hypothetical protein
MTNPIIAEAINRYTTYLECLEKLNAGAPKNILKNLDVVEGNRLSCLRCGPHSLGRIRNFLQDSDHRNASIELLGLIGDEFRHEAHYVQCAVKATLPAPAKTLLSEAANYSNALEQSQQAACVLGYCNRALTEPKDLREITRRFRAARRVIYRTLRLSDAEIAQAEREDSEDLCI